MALELFGTLKVIGPDQQITASFKKREAVIVSEDQYPQTIMVEFHQDKTEYLDGYQVGEKVKISFNIRSREWVSPQGETKYFSTLAAWRIERANATPQQPQAPSYPAMNNNPTDVAQSADNEEEDSDLPF